MLLVYLTLAAQYESLVLPFIVLLGVPLAVLGALSAQWARGLQNDLYCQIGLVLLVGLAAKNSILIVEFAEQLRGRGMTVIELQVAPGDLGRVIGRNGRTAAAVRTLLSAPADRTTGRGGPRHVPGRPRLPGGTGKRVPGPDPHLPRLRRGVHVLEW